MTHFSVLLVIPETTSRGHSAWRYMRYSYPEPIGFPSKLKKEFLWPSFLFDPFRPEVETVNTGNEILSLNYDPETIIHLGPGSGGIAMAHRLDIYQSFSLPIRMKEVSDIYDCNY